MHIWDAHCNASHTGMYCSSSLHVKVKPEKNQYWWSQKNWTSHKTHVSGTPRKGNISAAWVGLRITYSNAHVGLYVYGPIYTCKLEECAVLRRTPFRCNHRSDRPQFGREGCNLASYPRQFITKSVIEIKNYGKLKKLEIFYCRQLSGRHTLNGYYATHSVSKYMRFGIRNPSRKIEWR